MSDNLAKVSFPFHLGGPCTTTADKQFSVYVSRTLDCLGKSQDMVKHRVNMYKKLQEIENGRKKHVQNTIAGSKGEGITSIIESDMDTMIVYSDVICADNTRPFMNNRNITVFQTDTYNTHAGYTQLKLVKFEGHMSCSVIKYSLFGIERGAEYLSSELFVKNIAHNIFRDNNTGSKIRYERNGPSLPVSDPEGHRHEDRVFAFRCVCSSLLQPFLTRPRPYNRPSRDILQDISIMEAHVVPVGHKDSITAHLEWRICFTKAETYLVQRLNKTEIKLYIILKMVSKLMKFISKDITSYVMKNIVLWLVELYPEDLFTEDLLTYQLIQALQFLKKCVIANFLPSYMIPKRNLLTDRLHSAQRLQLTTFLSTLIQERGYLLLRFEKLRNGITLLYRKPDMAREFQKRRDMAEKVWLLRIKIRYEKIVTTGLSAEEVERLMDTKSTIAKIKTTLIKIACQEKMFLLRQECTGDALSNLCTDRLRQMFS